jgi:fatty-acyl-CoA synthase
MHPREMEQILDDAGVAQAFASPKIGAELAVGSASASELDVHLLERIARFKRPKRYEFIDELPKNSYGKVLKRELRARLA